MAKIMFICIVLGLVSLLWMPHSVEAKPFFLKFFDVSQNVNTVRTTPRTPVVSTFVLTDFLARKLEFLAGILANTGSVSYNVGFNKVGQAASTTQQTTTTSRPISTTPVQTVFVPESTESLVKAPLAVTEMPVIGQRISSEVVLGVASTALPPAIAAPTTAGITAATIAPTLAPASGPISGPAFVSITASTTAGAPAASAGAPATSAGAPAASAGAPAASAGAPTASAGAPAASAGAPAASAGAPAGNPAIPAAAAQPSLGLTFASSIAPQVTPTIATAPASSPAPFARPSIPPTPASSTDNIIILSLFDQTVGSSTSAPGNPSATVGSLLPVNVTTTGTLTGGFSVADDATKRTGYGYSDPSVLLFDASNEIFNDVQKSLRSPETETLDLDIRT